MELFADTSAWSLAVRRDDPSRHPAATTLLDGLRGRHDIYATGLVLQEILQGFRGPRRRDEIMQAFRSVDFVTPTFDDHVAAADVRNACRRGGVQIKTIDALLASLCIRRGLLMLTADKDFRELARHAPLELWEPDD